MEAKYITITPTSTKDADQYYTGYIALFNSEKEIEESKSFDSWFIDSFSIIGKIQMDFEFTDNGEGIRLWGMNGEPLHLSKCYSPTIYSDPLC